MNDREMLITEMWLLNREIGYVTFRAEFFTDADAMRKWPDPAVRERELRDFWNDEASADYPKFHDAAATISSERLTGYRDQLQSDLASRRQNARLPCPAEIAGQDRRDDAGMPDAGVPRKGLKALFAEWETDYAARRAEDAQVRERPMDARAAEARGGPEVGRGR